MDTKKLLKFIHLINYTTEKEKNKEPLTGYDEGFKAACNLTIGAIKGLSWTPFKNLCHRLWIWRNRKDLKNDNQRTNHNAA